MRLPKFHVNITYNLKKENTSPKAVTHLHSLRHLPEMQENKSLVFDNKMRHFKCSTSNEAL